MHGWISGKFSGSAAPRTLLRFLSGSLLLCLFLFAALAAQAQDIGSIERVNGTVSITAAGGPSRAAEAAGRLQDGDLIATGTDGEVLIKMKDNALFALRANTQFRLAEYKFDNQASDSSITNLIKGAVRSVSGLIAKAQPARVRLTTPTATIGIRGTDYEVMVVEQDSADGRAGTYNLVNDGATSLQLANGQNLEVTREQTGFAPAQFVEGVTRLLIFRERPNFFRGGIFDNVLVQMAAQLVTDRAQQELQRRLPIPSIPGIGNPFDFFNKK